MTLPRPLGGRVPRPVCHQTFGRLRLGPQTGLSAELLAAFIDGRLLGIMAGAILGFATLSSGSILRSTETGAFPDAEAVARSLAGHLAAGDAVITQAPASLPELQYYFARAGLPIDALVRPPETAERVYVVAPDGATPRLEGWSTARPIDRFAGSELFELAR